MEGEASQQAPAQQPQPPQPSRSTQELAEDGQKQLEAVVEAAHDILLTLNRALCSPSFWVAPSSQPALAQEINPNANANAASGGSDGGLGLGDGAAAGKEKGADDGEGLAALDATRVRYKNATAALRATVAAIVKAAQEGEGAEDMETGELDYLEQRADSLREEVEKKNQIVKLHIDQLRSLIADMSMWQGVGL